MCEKWECRILRDGKGDKGGREGMREGRRDSMTRD